MNTADLLSMRSLNGSLTNVYGLPPKYKGLIDRNDMREEPAVVYPASEVDSVVVRADMESASPLRQSLRAAGIQLPGELSASNGMGVSLGAMTGDQSLRKGGYVQLRFVAYCSGRHRVRRIVKLLAHARNASSIDFSITQVA